MYLSLDLATTRNLPYSVSYALCTGTGLTDGPLCGACSYMVSGVLFKAVLCTVGFRVVLIGCVCFPPVRLAVLPFLQKAVNSFFACAGVA